MQSAAALIIGNELLSGKIADRNTPVLIAFLRKIGVALRRISVIEDVQEQIATQAHELAQAHDWVFTSGGLGPTHDDCTIAAIAQAFDVQVIRHPLLETQLRQHMGDRVNGPALRMAEVPEGATLVGNGPFPTIRFRNILILPGIPDFFAAKLPLLNHLFQGTSLHLSRVYLDLPETKIAVILGEIDSKFHGVDIGSYPRTGVADHMVMVTFEGPDAEAVKLATRALIDALPADKIRRVDDDPEGA